MSTFIEQAANAFMLMQVSIGKAAPMKRSKQASQTAAEQCQVSSNVPVATHVGALASMTTDLKAVISKYNAVRTYLYEHSLPMSDDSDGQRRGERLVPITKIPKVLADLAVLKAEAEKALTEFLPRYTTYFEARQRSDLGTIRDVDMPQPSELAGKFYIKVRDPEPLSTPDLSNLNLPASLAAQLSERRTSALASQLEGAKQAAMSAARDHMDTIVTQLTSGSRLSQSLIDNAKHHAVMLRDMISGYDNDPRVTALADLIDEKVVSAGTTERLKNSESLKQSAVRAAKTVSKGLGDIAKAPAPAVVAAPAAIVTGDSMLADLLD